MAPIVQNKKTNNNKSNGGDLGLNFSIGGLCNSNTGKKIFLFVKEINFRRRKFVTLILIAFYFFKLPYKGLFF